MSDRVEVKESPAAVEDNVAVVRSVYEAFGRRDMPAVFERFHPDCVIYQSSRLPWGGRYEGHEGFGEFLARLTAAIESRVRDVRYIDDEEDHVAAIGHTHGRALATGREFDVPQTHIWTVRDGKVSEVESYIDTRMMRDALGL